MQASSAAFSRCSLPGVMFHASPEQSCCGTSSQLVPSLLRYQVYTAPSSLSVLPLTFAVKQPSVRMLSTSSALVTTAVCAAVSGAASSASITRVRAVSGVAAGSAAGVGPASMSGSGAGGSGSAGAIAAADSAVAGSSSAAKTALAMPAAIQQASSTANRRFFMYGSSFAGFPCGACPPAGSIGSIPCAARGTRRGLLSARRLQKRRTTVKNRGASFFYSLLPCRGRACPALHLSASARLWDTCGPGIPGPYCLCNGEMRCKGTLAGRACPAPTARLGDTAPLPRFTPPSPASHSRRSRRTCRCPRG